MPNLIIPTYCTDFLDENGKVSRVWLRYFQTLYDRTGDWDASLIENQFSATNAEIAEISKASREDSTTSPTLELAKTVDDLSLQLAASIGQNVELQKRFDDLQLQIDFIAQASFGSSIRDLEIKIESIPDSSASVAELKKSALTKNNKLSDLAPTTSAEFATVITDETGTGKVVFSTSPVLVTPNIGAATGSSLSLSGPSGSAGVIAVTDGTSNGVNILMSGNGAITPSKSLRVANGFFQIVNSAYSSVIFNMSDVGAVSITNAFGCNNIAPQTSFSVGSAATDLPTVITLANNLRTALINNGIAS